MISEELLKNMDNIDVGKIQKDSLVDIKDVVINSAIERNERISDYIRQIKNPYCCVCEGVIVKMKFARTGDTLEEKLHNYFSSL